MSTAQEQIRTPASSRSWIWKLATVLIPLSCLGALAFAFSSVSGTRMSDEVSIPVVNGAHSYSASVSGEMVPLDQFAAIMVGSSTTTLARESFIQSANGCIVEWDLRLEDMRQTEDAVQGDFCAQASFEERSHSNGYQIHVSCLFDPKHLEMLLTLQKKQMVRVRGTLGIDKRKSGHQAAVIRNAKILLAE